MVFNEFDTESSYDSLKIFDGPSRSSAEIAYISGQHSGPVYLSSGSALWFEFSSDSSNTRRGFHANYTAIQSSGMCVWDMLFECQVCTAWKSFGEAGE